MRSARCSPGRLAVTLTCAHTHGPDRDKWSPQRGEERIETGAITQNLHSYSGKKTRTRICADAWTHVCCQTKTHAPRTLVCTQWPKTPARTEPLVCVLGEPFFWSNGEESHKTQERKPNGQRLHPRTRVYCSAGWAVQGYDGRLFLFLTDSKSKLKSEAQNQIITLNRIFAHAATVSYISSLCATRPYLSTDYHKKITVMLWMWCVDFRLCCSTGNGQHRYHNNIQAQ